MKYNKSKQIIKESRIILTESFWSWLMALLATGAGAALAYQNRDKIEAYAETIQPGLGNKIGGMIDSVTGSAGSIGAPIASAAGNVVDTVKPYASSVYDSVKKNISNWASHPLATPAGETTTAPAQVQQHPSAPQIPSTPQQLVPKPANVNSGVVYQNYKPMIEGYANPDFGLIGDPTRKDKDEKTKDVKPHSDTKSGKYSTVDPSTMGSNLVPETIPKVIVKNSVNAIVPQPNLPPKGVEKLSYGTSPSVIGDKNADDTKKMLSLAKSNLGVTKPTAGSVFKFDLLKKIEGTDKAIKESAKIKVKQIVNKPTK